MRACVRACGVARSRERPTRARQPIRRAEAPPRAVMNTTSCLTHVRGGFWSFALMAVAEPLVGAALLTACNISLSVRARRTWISFPSATVKTTLPSSVLTAGPLCARACSARRRQKGQAAGGKVSPQSRTTVNTCPIRPIGAPRGQASYAYVCGHDCAVACGVGVRRAGLQPTRECGPLPLDAPPTHSQDETMVDFKAARGFACATACASGFGTYVAALQSSARLSLVANFALRLATSALCPCAPAAARQGKVISRRGQAGLRPKQRLHMWVLAIT